MKDLLLLLCRYPFEEKNREILTKLLGEVKDWDDTTALINAHGIIALAANNIKEAGLEKEIPAEAMAALENGYRQSVVRNLWLKERWKEVNEILSNAGIRHILLKGMALEHTLYGSKGLRQMNDNDILIKREEAKEAWYLLQKHGFTFNLPKSPLHLRIMRDISHHLPALQKDGYSVEIHTTLFDFKTTQPYSYHDFFENAPEITISGEKALVLENDIHLKYLISHFERHLRSGECQMRTFADIRILTKEATFEFPDQFVLNPDQKDKTGYKKAAFKSKVNFIPPRYRLFFVLGDLFPSVNWMKERYGCSRMKAILYYPHRWGKLWWLL